MRNKAGAWFNGVDSYVAIPQKVIDGASNYTVIVGLNDIANKPSYSGILRHGYDIYIYRSDRYLRGEIKQKDDAWKVTLAPYENGIALWRKNGMFLEMFLNGVKVSEALLTDTPKISSDRYVGKTTNTTVSRGIIQRVLFYGRALKDDEIDALFQKNVIPRDPALFYDFRLGHALDLSGNGNHGTPHNVEFVGVHTRSGLWFPGMIGSYVDIGNIFAGAQQLVIGVEADIRITGQYQGLIGKWSDGGDREWLIYVSPTGYLYLAILADGKVYNKPNGICEGIHKIIAIINNGTLSVYVDGISRGNINYVGTISATAKAVEIGNYNNGNRPMDGLIKSAWIKTSIPFDIAQEFLKWGQNADAYWDFTIGTLKDLSGNGYDGVAYGQVQFVGI